MFGNLLRISQIFKHLVILFSKKGHHYIILSYFNKWFIAQWCLQLCVFGLHNFLFWTHKLHLRLHAVAQFHVSSCNFHNTCTRATTRSAWDRDHVIKFATWQHPARGEVCWAWQHSPLVSGWNDTIGLQLLQKKYTVQYEGLM